MPLSKIHRHDQILEHNWNIIIGVVSIFDSPHSEPVYRIESYVTNYGAAIIMISAVLAGEEGGRKRE